MRSNQGRLNQGQSKHGRTSKTKRRRRTRVTLQQLESRQLMAADGFDLHDHDHDHHHDHDHDHHHDETPALIRHASGHEFFVDPMPNLDAADVISSAPAVGDTASIAAVGGVPALQSKPGADQTLFLDFDGHVVAGTYWNDLNNGNPIHADPFSTDADVFNFSDSELQRIEEIFRRVAEDFAPFDVNVSTVDPGEAAFREGGRALRTIISTDYDSAASGGTGNRWFQDAGGVAYLRSFDWRSDTPVWVFENNLGNGNEKYVAEATSHEIGHALGLSHDGTSSVGYYRGQGSGQVAWAPIMGVGYNRPLSQWSTGQYADANNTQDDIAIITSRLGTEVDVVGDTIADATPLIADATGSFDVGGLIETAADVDVFQFTTGGGQFDVAAEPFDVADGKANLDVSLALVDAAGSLVASANPGNLITAAITTTLAAGTYYLSVDGVGWGDPLTTGYTDYGSLGWYDLVGSFVPVDEGSNQDGFLPLSNDNVVTYGQRQDVSADSVVVDGELRLAGNTWRQTAIEYTVTPQTVLEFEFATSAIGEIHGIGLDNDDAISRGYTFQLAGTQNWGNRDATYVGGGDFQAFSINVGEFYTGEFTSLFFVNDNDAGGSANGQFRNIRIYEADEPLNLAPVAANDQAQTISGGEVTIDVLGNDTDPDGDDLTVTEVSGATGGSASVVDNAIVYNAAADFVGTETLTYTVTDGRGKTDTATVTVTVESVTDGPLRFDLLGVNSHGGNQDAGGTASLFASGEGLYLAGNTWKSVPLNYTVTADTVLQFELATNGTGEIIGIGFDRDGGLSAGQTFRLAGTQRWGIAATSPDPGDGGFRTVTIRVGDYFTGNFDRLVFANDHDVSNPTAESAYRNVRIFEQPAVIGLDDVDDDATIFDTLRQRIDQFDARPRVTQRLNRLVDRLERRYDSLAVEQQQRIDDVVQAWLDRMRENSVTDLVMAGWTLR